MNRPCVRMDLLAGVAVVTCLTSLTSCAWHVEGNSMATMREPRAACVTVLRRLSIGDFKNWTGLPGGCTSKEVQLVLSGGESSAIGRISDRSTQFRVYESPQHSEVIQVWFDDADRVLLITLVAPTIKGDVNALLRTLGPPERKLEPSVGHHADAHQWIYAGRGITLYVRERSNEIARVAVYPPTTVEQYELKLGANDTNTYWPWERTR